MRNKHALNPQLHGVEEYKALSLCASVTEAAQIIGYDTRYIARLADMGYIAARKSNNIWIVSLNSISEYARLQAEKRQNWR